MRVHAWICVQLCSHLLQLRALKYRHMSWVSKLEDRETPFTTCPCATSKSTPTNCELNGGPT